MSNIKFFKEENLALEMHKVRIVQKLNLLPIDERLNAMKEAGNNTFLLRNKDVYLDMLTDSGTNAMSDRQLGAMMVADDSYAGSETFYKLEKQVKNKYNIYFAYEDMNVVMNILKQNNAEQKNQIFDLNCQIEVLIDKRNTSKFEASIPPVSTIRIEFVGEE